MNPLKRLVSCALLFGIQALYFPLNRYLEGGTLFKTPLDDRLPLWPAWVIPYVLIFVWWIGAYTWAAWRMEARLYESFFLSSACMQVSALTIFNLFPTYVLRPELHSTGGLAQLLNWIYTHDYAYNAFPSGHVYITTLIALFWSRWYPDWRWLWIGTVLLVIPATLFTGQHYLPDPLGGLLLAWLSYQIGMRCMPEAAAVRSLAADRSQG